MRYFNRQMYFKPTSNITDDWKKEINNNIKILTNVESEMNKKRSLLEKILRMFNNPIKKRINQRQTLLENL